MRPAFEVGPIRCRHLNTGHIPWTVDCGEYDKQRGPSPSQPEYAVAESLRNECETPKTEYCAPGHERHRPSARLSHKGRDNCRAAAQAIEQSVEPQSRQASKADEQQRAKGGKGREWVGFAESTRYSYMTMPRKTDRTGVRHDLGDCPRQHANGKNEERDTKPVEALRMEIRSRQDEKE